MYALYGVVRAWPRTLGNSVIIAGGRVFFFFFFEGLEVEVGWGGVRWLFELCAVRTCFF